MPDLDADPDSLGDKGVQHEFEYWAVSKAHGVWCQGCDQKWNHGSLCFCTLCKPTATKCDTPQGLHLQDKARGAGVQDLLNGWVAQPAPPTAVHTPQSLRKRVAQLMVRQIRRAVDATMAAHDISESAMKESLETKALLEHQLLWAIPALLTGRMPDQCETDQDPATKPSRAEGIQRLKQQRARIQKVEQGMWTDLLQEALQERETPHGRLEDTQQTGHS